LVEAFKRYKQKYALASLFCDAVHFLELTKRTAINHITKRHIDLPWSVARCHLRGNSVYWT